MRITRTLWRCLPLAVLLAGFRPPAEAQAPVQIRLATVLPKGTSYHNALSGMREKWRLAPNGGVKLTIYDGGVLGDEPDIVRKMNAGALQAGLLSVVGLSEIDKSVTALSYMPMMFRSLEEVQHIRLKLQPDLERRLAAKGYVVLFWGDAGWIRFFARDAALLPADFKKQKIFVWSGDSQQLDIMKALGYSPVPLVTGDILVSLRTGMISAVPMTPFYALAGQIYTPGLASHMLELNWAPLVGATVVRKKDWDAIRPDTRAALAKAAREAGDEMQQRGHIEAEQAVAAMKKRGLVVHPVTSAMEAEWRREISRVYPMIRGRMVPAEMFDEVQRLLAQFRAAGGKAGSK